MSEILTIDFKHYFKMAAMSIAIDDEVFAIKFNAANASNQTLPPVRLDLALILVCTNGECSLTLDYKDYVVKKGSMLMLNSLHVIENRSLNDNFEGYILAVSRDKAKSIVDGIQGIGKVAQKINRYPVTQLEDSEIQLLAGIFDRIIMMQNNTSHFFQKDIIKNEVGCLFMEILQIRLSKDSARPANDDAATRGENIAIEFVRLALTHCRKEHEVSYYAGRLCMTAGNLSRIMKAHSGKTAIKWINDALITEAKILLSKPNATIQYVADELHFADQSSFGKFFRKHTGLTPKEYRKNIGKYLL